MRAVLGFTGAGTVLHAQPAPRVDVRRGGATLGGGVQWIVCACTWPA